MVDRRSDPCGSSTSHDRHLGAQAQAAKDREKSVELENELRRTLIQIIGGIVVFVGAYVTWQEFQATKQNIEATQRVSSKQVELTEKGQVTDRFTRAIDQLGDSGKNNLATRLGGIYALDRLAADSLEYYWPVMEVLTAYVRENARWRRTGEDRVKEDTQEILLPTDIQAILTVLARRNIENDRGPVELYWTDLHGAFLWNAQLPGVNLYQAHLYRAHLAQANLEAAQLVFADLSSADLAGANLKNTQLWNIHLVEADLTGANLKNAVLNGADLAGAYLENANLAGANLQNANLVGADLKNANLAGADLSCAHLERADLGLAVMDGTYLGYVRLSGVALTQEQLNVACADDTTDRTGTRLGRPDRRPCCDEAGGCWKE